MLNSLRNSFIDRFGNPTSSFVFASAPGRVELAGNHTDHQGGLVISGAIDLRCWGLATLNGTSQIRLAMEDFGEASFDLNEAGALEPRECEQGTSLSLVRGMAAQFAQAGGTLRGFDMVTCSDIPAGCGVSSSAAFEMLIGTVLQALDTQTDEKPTSEASQPEAAAINQPWSDPIALALAGMQAERTFFGKPCGAQDQIASACGNVVAMDFSCNPPLVKRLGFDANDCDYALCLIDSQADHSRYTSEFADITNEMHQVAALFGCDMLGKVDVERFLANLGKIRSQLSDRHALRALHFFSETNRVAQQRQALECNDFEAFLERVRLSGSSSAQFLQNVSPEEGKLEPNGQPAMVILALCAHLLKTQGAWRIHGGGFGGSVLAFVPREQAAQFAKHMNECLGYDACRTLSISEQGVWAEQVD